MALFLAGAVLLGLWLFPRLVKRVARWSISQPTLTLIATAQAPVGNFGAVDTGTLFTIPVARVLRLGPRL